MKTYKIKEIETNVTYDDIYTSVEEAEQQIEIYKADDGEEREITYIVIEVEKTKIYEIRRDIKNGDSFNEWSFDLDKAQQKAKSIRAHLTASENANSDVYIIGYKITCNKKLYDAEDLYTACFNDDIDVPEFDSLTGGFTDESQFYFEKVEA